METQVEGCGMNSDKGKWKSFGLLKCKGETQESAVALIRLFKCKHAFISSVHYEPNSALCLVLPAWLGFIKTFDFVFMLIFLSFNSLDFFFSLENF